MVSVHMAACWVERVLVSVHVAACWVELVLVRLAA
jgi:hypothetical protein